jgi:hypothetical protein
LRRKQAQNAPALSLTRGLNKMPEHMDALLTRLGVLLDTLTALPVPPYEPSRRSRDAASEAKQLDVENENIKYKDGVFNRFLNMLTRELVWGRQTIRQRLTVGRLQSEISSYIKQRLEVYQRLRDAVRDDIASQRVRAIAEGKDVVHSKEWYSADWARLMRFLLDISMLTDDASEAVEELEAWRGKKSGGSAAGEDGARHPDPDEIRGWEGVLQSAWNKLDISPEAYEPAHLPLLTCVTESLYANLPLLWRDPAATAAAAGGGEGDHAAAAPPSSSSSLLMSESVVEAAIDQAERDYAEQQQAEEEAKQRAEEAAAAEKAQQEAAAREEAERLLKAADEERAAAAAREREQKRRERKAAKKAEAAAAAAAAAGTVPSATPSLQLAPPGIVPMEGADGSAAPSAAKAAAAGMSVTPTGAAAVGGAAGAGAAGGAGRPKAELRGEGESRQKKCCGALCAKAAPTEGGLWRPLTDFAPQASCAGGVAMRCRACDRQRKQDKKSAVAAAGPPAKPQPPATPVRSNVFAPLPPLEVRWKVPSMNADNPGARASSSTALQSPKPTARSTAAAPIAAAPDASAMQPAGSAAATAATAAPRTSEGSVSPPLLQPIAAVPTAAAALAPPPAPSAAAAPAGPLLASWGEDS